MKRTNPVQRLIALLLTFIATIELSDSTTLSVLSSLAEWVALLCRSFGLQRINLLPSRKVALCVAWGHGSALEILAISIDRSTFSDQLVCRQWRWLGPRTVQMAQFWRHDLIRCGQFLSLDTWLPGPLEQRPTSWLIYLTYSPAL